MSSHVTAIGHLIHEMANAQALEHVKQQNIYDQGRGSGFNAERDVKRYNDSYEYHSKKLLWYYGFMTREEFQTWENSRSSY